MKRLGLAIMAIALCVNFISCSSDDNGGSSEPGGTTPATEAGKVSITTSAPVVNSGAESTSISFTVNGNWTATSDQSWCTVSPASGNVGTTTITVSCAENTTYDERNASVTIKCGTATDKITITQKQKDAILFSSDRQTVDVEGGDVTIKYQANVTATYEIEEAAKSWLSVSTRSTRALTDYSVAFTATANDALEAREGKITFVSGDLKETVTVYQFGNEPALVLGNDNVTVGDAKDTIKVELQDNLGYEPAIEITEGSSWIHELKDGTRAMSSYTKRFIIDANPDYEERVGKIRFYDTAHGLEQMFTVTQTQHNALVIAKTMYTIDEKGGTITVQTKENCTYTITPNVSWITQSNTRALTDNTITFTVDAMADGFARGGKISFKNVNLGIDQDIYVGQSKSSLTLTELSTNNLTSLGVPHGSFSGITWMGDNKYTVCDDHALNSGLWDFTIDLDNTGTVTSASATAFSTTEFSDEYAGHAKWHDPEAVIYHPSTDTYYVAGEYMSTMWEYDRNGNRTGNELTVPEQYDVYHIREAFGFESLGYNANVGQFWYTTEKSLLADWGSSDKAKHQHTLRLQCQDENHNLGKQVLYETEDFNQYAYTHGVSDILVLDDGRLILIEREVYVSTQEIIDHYQDWGYTDFTGIAPTDYKCKTWLFLVDPRNVEDGGKVSKTQLDYFETKVNSIASPAIADYEGICLGPKVDGKQTILLMSDTQNGMGGSITAGTQTMTVTMQEWLKVYAIE